MAWDKEKIRGLAGYRMEVGMREIGGVVSSGGAMCTLLLTFMPWLTASRLRQQWASCCQILP
jgi:hypothetical protein